MKIIGFGLVVLVLLISSVFVWIQWNNAEDGRSSVDAYPITILENGSGIESSTIIDKTRIENASHLTDEDFSKYPALWTLFLSEPDRYSGHVKMRGISPDDEAAIRKYYSVSEYNGTYYLVMIILH